MRQQSHLAAQLSPDIVEAAEALLVAIQRSAVTPEMARRWSDPIVRGLKLPVKIIRAKHPEPNRVPWSVGGIVFAVVPRCQPSIWLLWKKSRLACMRMCESHGYVLHRSPEEER
jgi:hypothetical protein